LLFDQAAIHSIPSRSHPENSCFGVFLLCFFFVWLVLFLFVCFGFFEVHSLQMYCQIKKKEKIRKKRSYMYFEE